MSLLEVVLIGIALSMDAATVSMTNSMVYKKINRKKLIGMPLMFGIFQGLMPLIGYFAGGLISVIISLYSGILVFIILGVLGTKMLYDGLRKHVDENRPTPKFTYKLLFIQAIATSIDAFAVGIGFSAMNVEIFPAITIIAITTAIVSTVAIFIGKKFGGILGNMASLLGGVILVALAIKALFM